jgi:hypothetical protein
MITGMGDRMQLTAMTDKASIDVSADRSAPAPRRLSAVLWPGLAALSICVFWTLAESTRVGVPAPFEDAAMLFKYAENMAHGWGIVWNPGQAPGATDGATDLGFVLVLAALHYLGVPTVVGALLVNLAAVFGVGALLGVLNATLWRRSVWLPVGLAVLVAGGPANRYVLSGFSPPVMGFLLLAAFTLAALAARPAPNRYALALFAWAGAAAAAAGWWRPEGFAFGPLVVLFGILLTSPRGVPRSLRSARVWAVLLAPYLAVVVGWAVLRVEYFGQLLPTSAVMKSGAVHAENAAFSIQFYGSLLLPLIGVLVAIAMARRSSRSPWIVVAILTAPLLWVNSALPQDFWQKIGVPFAPTVSVVATVVVFVPLIVALAITGVRRRDGSWLFPVALLVCSLAWIALATTLNWWGRMQWPLVPVLAVLAAHLIVTAPPVEWVAASTRRARIGFVALLACIGVLPFHLPIGSYFESPFQTNVAEALRTVDTTNVRIATTEAGLIPLAVTGSALDTYGHNNRNIAITRGRSLAAELEAFRPNALAVHGLPPEDQSVDGCTALQRAAQPKFSERWSQMVTDIYAYAAGNGLSLVRMSQTTPCETWSVWLSDTVDAPVRHAVETLPMPGTEVAVRHPTPGG